MRCSAVHCMSVCSDCLFVCFLFVCNLKLLIAVWLATPVQLIIDRKISDEHQQLCLRFCGLLAFVYCLSVLSLTATHLSDSMEKCGELAQATCSYSRETLLKLRELTLYNSTPPDTLMLDVFFCLRISRVCTYCMS